MSQVLPSGGCPAGAAPLRVFPRPLWHAALLITALLTWGGSPCAAQETPLPAAPPPTISGSPAVRHGSPCPSSSAAGAQTASGSASVSFGSGSPSSAQQQPSGSHCGAAALSPEAAKSAANEAAAAAARRERAAEELRLEEKQRVLGVVPNFNTVLGGRALPLSPAQKFHLAFRSAIDPFTFVAAGFDSAISQATNEYEGYGQGWLGYGKRFGASYADTADGTLWGNAILPVLLHEDPRYFRMGQGAFRRRFLYAAVTTVIAKNDDGKWGPNLANVGGNLIAGGISNLYYPAEERGIGLTFERGFTVTAEGAIGAEFDEFWPDISKKLFNRRPRKGIDRP